jgi:hypothetical protein
VVDERASHTMGGLLVQKSSQTVRAALLGMLFRALTWAINLRQLLP